MNIIGELMNNSYGRARKAWSARSLEGYQNLAKIQSDLGVDYLTLNVDGTQQISVSMEEMLEFLPTLVPALQEATNTPISFDNPSAEYHRVALKHYDRSKSPAPILNSLAASRTHLDEMIQLIKDYDTNVIVMASEHYVDGESVASLDPRDSHKVTKHFVDRLLKEAGRTKDQIIVDPGLAPVGADTYGLINTGLNSMRLMSADPELEGIHFIVGLSNFAWGTPKAVRHDLERAYLTLAAEVGLDFALANPENTPVPLPSEHPLVDKLREALEAGTPRDGESQEDAGYRQTEVIMEICSEALDDDD